MKKYLGLIFSFLALASCSHDDIIVSKPTVFTAVTEGSLTDGQSRVTLTGTSLSWQLGDQIRVAAFPVGSVYPVNGYFEATSGGSSTTSFVHVSGDPLNSISGRYLAGYPAQSIGMSGDLDKAIGFWENTLNVGIGIKIRQEYAPGSVDPHTFPMFAESSTTNLSFRNMSALLCFKITSSVDFILDSLAYCNREDSYYDDFFFINNFYYRNYADSMFFSYNKVDDIVYYPTIFSHYAPGMELMNINEPLGTTQKDFYLCVVPTRYDQTQTVSEYDKLHIKKIRLWGHKSDGTPVVKTFNNTSSAGIIVDRSTITNVTLNVTGYDA
ncbi:MAG: hypothetical protein IKR18_00860 [Bacteroidaceae bacterium]|nr:hypothetical protein [Bacteroidaceae bacterium]